MQTSRRLQKELERMQKEPVVGIEAKPNGEDLHRWTAQILGPEGSVYEGGSFEVDMQIPARYPMEPPKLKFRTPIFHPNVSNSGDICLDVLKNHWSPALTLQKVLLSLSSLLTDPNFGDPLNGTASQLFRKNRAGYDAKCREMTRQHAMNVTGAEAGKGKKRSLDSVSTDEDILLEPHPAPGDAIGRRPAAKTKAKAKPKAKSASGKAKAKASSRP
eukprot:TRINITY_DN33043_c0_g1_i1.p1 TRINITY_DN33043_c0_g1~~TRINITY_DN33043_c0_g1_i1.p1  ORF type:complete len:216 (+),score=32.01 TRINITY_DN33043_c0_g1_i1:44-691(+)